MSYKNHYTGLEKLLHQIAFHTTGIQCNLAEAENIALKSHLNKVPIIKPVFVTALPRAGTTLFLETLFQTGEFASHQYSDMPFVLTPVIWRSLSKIGRKKAPKIERAHGDGILINAESPEAFDEIIWKTFWKARYHRNHISPTFGPSFPEFEKFYTNHIRKLIWISANGRDKFPRYLAKNNLLISRLSYLSKLFPDGKLILLFRAPLQHANSLLRQHKNFLDIHRKDKFARSYMLNIGHFDFGENLRPVNFNNWLLSPAPNAESLEFWITYWINAYNYLLNHAPKSVLFVWYDDLCRRPKPVLKKVASFLNLQNPDSLVNQHSKIKSPKLYSPNLTPSEKEILAEATKVFDFLKKIYFRQFGLYVQGQDGSRYAAKPLPKNG